MPLLSITEAVGTGSAMNVAVPPYLDKSHISVYVDSLKTEAFDWINEQTISIVAPLNRKVRVIRKTSHTALLTSYMDGTSLPGDTLEVDSKQAFYMAQEAMDLATLGGSFGGQPQPGVELTTEGIIALLNGQITPSLLELELRKDIELIKAGANEIGSPAWLVEQERLAREGAIQATYEVTVQKIANEAGERAAAIADEATLREDADGILASQVNTVAAQVGSVNAAVQSEQQARIDADGALASDIDTVVAFVDGADARIAAVETAAEAVVEDIGTVKSQYTIKVQARADGKRVIAGIGLSATIPSDGPSQSEMVFLADKFTFVPSMEGLNVIPQPLLFMGVVNGVNTLVIPPQRLGDRLVESRMLIEGSIEARHAAFTNRGVNLDPEFKMGAIGWLNFGERREGSAQPLPSPVGYSAFFAGRDGYMLPIARRITVTQDETFRIRCWVYRQLTYTSGIVVFGFAADGGVIQTVVYEPPAVVGWHQIDVSHVVAPGVVRMSVAPWNGLPHSDPQGTWFAELLVERMTDNALVVEGGLKADRIDTRGLQVKDIYGNIILASGQPLPIGYVPAGAQNSNISLGANGALSGAGGGQVTYSGIGGRALGLIDAITQSNASTYIADAWIGQAIVNGQLQSSNYNSGVSGWALAKSGNMEVWNLVARGDIWASNVYANAVHTNGIQQNAVTSGNAAQGGYFPSSGGADRPFLATGLTVSEFARTVSVKGLFKVTTGGYQTDNITITLKMDSSPMKSWSFNGRGVPGEAGTGPVPTTEFVPFLVVHRPANGYHVYTLEARNAGGVIEESSIEVLVLNR